MRDEDLSSNLMRLGYFLLSSVGKVQTHLGLSGSETVFGILSSKKIYICFMVTKSADKSYVYKSLKRSK